MDEIDYFFFFKRKVAPHSHDTICHNWASITWLGNIYKGELCLDLDQWKSHRMIFNRNLIKNQMFLFQENALQCWCRLIQVGMSQCFLGPLTLITRFMGPIWGPSGADRTQMGPMLAPWTLLSGLLCLTFYWLLQKGQISETAVSFYCLAHSNYISCAD